MRFRSLELPGAYLIEAERHEDERGFFVRTWCREEFARHVNDISFVQASQSFNRRTGTLRGLHFQAPPFAETKLVRCIRGAAYDVIADIRPGSPTYGRWLSTELSEENGLALLVPEGMAHGFQTLADGTVLAYQISAVHRPEAARGIRWNDPALGVKWPLPVSAISARDQEWANFAAEHAA
jgi:dTDP-4-dehydrorhamnose 3,5-epimerase